MNAGKLGGCLGLGSQHVAVNTTTGQPVNYALSSAPPYLVFRLPELLRELRAARLGLSLRAEPDPHS